MIARVCSILGRCDTGDTKVPPTLLYNEGWMLRVILDWFSRRPPEDHPLTFLPGASWYSEVLLHTQFQARYRADTLAESRTHADGAVGHFRVGGSGKGDLVVLPDANQLVIAEAKMFSGLSLGTKRARTYDQAARNVACIAETLFRAQRAPQAFDVVGFVIVAPASQIRSGLFERFVDKGSIEIVVADRVHAYDGLKDSWFRDWFLPTLETIRITQLSWEDCVNLICEREPEVAAEFSDFLRLCIRWNSIPGVSQTIDPTLDRTATPTPDNLP